MPLPIPDIIRQNIWFDAVGIGTAIGIGGWYLQGRYTDLRRERRQSRLTSDLAPERRRAQRATEAAGRTDKEQAADLRAAIDALVDFVDGAPSRSRAAACADKVAQLVPGEQRGSMTVQFLRMCAAGSPPARLQRMAEEVCVQMAVELRAIMRRAQSETPVTPALRPAAADGAQPPAPAPAAATKPARRGRRPAWELEEERIFEAGRAARVLAEAREEAAPATTPDEPAPATTPREPAAERETDAMPAEPAPAAAPAEPAPGTLRPATRQARPAKAASPRNPAAQKQTAVKAPPGRADGAARGGRPEAG